MISISSPEPGLLVITIDRPERRNAIDLAGFRALADAWRHLEDSDARVGIVTGAGGDFSSGADLRTLSDDVAVATRNGDGESAWQAIHAGILRDRLVTKPVIAAIEGVCFGGGMELIGGADLRVAGRSARFATPEVRHGVIPSGGSLARLPRQLPSAVAMELVLTGAERSAADLAKFGFLNRVVDDGGALDAARDLGRVIADNAPAAVRAAKRVVAEGARTSLAEAYELERAVGEQVSAREELREGVRAFTEKRAPAWRLS